MRAALKHQLYPGLSVADAAMAPRNASGETVLNIPQTCSKLLSLQPMPREVTEASPIRLCSIIPIVDYHAEIRIAIPIRRPQVESAPEPARSLETETAAPMAVENSASRGMV